MSNKLRTRSTDLTVLRSLLLSEEDDLKIQDSSNKLDNIITENSVAPEPDNLTISKDYQIKVVEINENHKLTKKKAFKDRSENDRSPFLVTRINSQHKRHSISVAKSTSESDKISMEASYPVYKSIHYNNILHKEDHLQQKYRQLATLLERDLIDRTTAICDQSMNEARQLIQNSLATSRIISSFVVDSQRPKNVSLSPSVASLFPPENSAKESFKHSDRLIPAEVTDCLLCNEVIVTDPTINPIGNSDAFHPPIKNAFTAVYGYGVPGGNLGIFDNEDNIHKSSSKRRTDNKLNSNDPYIQNWLQAKERRLYEQKRLEEKTKRIEISVSMNAEKVLEQRKSLSEEAFKQWCKEKARNVKKNLHKQSEDVLLGSSDNSSDEGLPQAGRQPRPVHNYVFKRPTLVRAKTANTFCIRSDLKMKLRGEKMELAKVETSRISTKSRPNLLENISINQMRPQTSMARVRANVPPLYSTEITKSFNRKSQFRGSKRKKKKSVSRKMSRRTDECNDDCENTKPESPYNDEENDEENVDGKLDNEVRQLTLTNSELSWCRKCQESSGSRSMDSEITFD